MIMTEEEAKKKRCTPAMVMFFADPERVNQYATRSSVPLGHTCIGSQCAQWAWYDYANKEGKTFFDKGEAPERANYHKGKSLPSKQVESEARPARGYCGMTGSKE